MRICFVSPDMGLILWRLLCACVLFCFSSLPAAALTAPAPAATARPSAKVSQAPQKTAGCVDRLASINVAESPTFPDGMDKESAETYTLVELHADGSIASTSVYRTSQDPKLDDAADEAANKSTYRAPRKNCVAYSSFVILKTPFNGGDKKIAPAEQDCAESAALIKGLAKPADKNSAKRGKRTGSVTVDVTVAADGTVAQSEVVESSGVDLLDADALRVAKASTYYPGRTACKPVESSVKLELTYF
jgi:TonB family protein